MSDTQSATPSQSPVLSLREQLIELLQSHWQPLEDEADQIESNLNDKRSEIEDLVNEVEELKSGFKQLTLGLEIEDCTMNFQDLLQLHEDHASANEKLQAARKAHGELELSRAELLTKINRTKESCVSQIWMQIREQKSCAIHLRDRLIEAAQSNYTACCAHGKSAIDEILFVPATASIYIESGNRWSDRNITLEWFTSGFSLAVHHFFGDEELLYRFPMQETTYIDVEDGNSKRKLELTHVLPSGENVKLSITEDEMSPQLKVALPIVTKAQGEGRCTACEEDSDDKSQ
ncbi:hypothetical protein HBI17_233020 [Parastagonospora nodorum]|nr:hypothetical protein HBI11_236640 [Parastagonospora nodorum]KAH5727492.1 hypothetical protein HBI17_233020 [Parastagonospora nodorum]KAH6028468.1 hypothetical protein HBI54_231340 [Parastagonospora nodorum]